MYTRSALFRLNAGSEPVFGRERAFKAERGDIAAAAHCRTLAAARGWSADAGAGAPSVSRLKLLVGERHARLARQVGERLAADVDHHALDRAAEERPRPVSHVVVTDRLGARISKSEPAAAKTELARLRHDFLLRDLLLADVEAQRPLRRQTLVLLLERSGDEEMAGREWLLGHDGLEALPDEVVDVLQLTAAHVERVAAEAGALRNNHAAGLLGLDFELGRDRVGAVADVRRD